MLGYMRGAQHRELKTLIEQLADFIAQKFFELEAKMDHLAATKLDKTDAKKMIEEVAERKTNKMLAAMDAYAARTDAYKQEHDMLSAQVNRHERWHHEAAKKLDIDLDY